MNREGHFLSNFQGVVTKQNLKKEGIYWYISIPYIVNIKTKEYSLGQVLRVKVLNSEETNLPLTWLLGLTVSAVKFTILCTPHPQLPMKAVEWGLGVFQRFMAMIRVKTWQGNHFFLGEAASGQFFVWSSIEMKDSPNSAESNELKMQPGFFGVGWKERNLHCDSMNIDILFICSSQ